MEWHPHITVAAIVEKNHKFLFIEEIANGNKVINQPAGHVEDGESFEEAVIRETLEETGWHIQPTYVVSIHRWLNKVNGETFFRVSFAANPISHDETQELDTGIIRPLWLNKEEVIEESALLRSPMVLDGLERYLQGTRYPLDLFVNL